MANNNSTSEALVRQNPTEDNKQDNSSETLLKSDDGVSIIEAFHRFAISNYLKKRITAVDVNSVLDEYSSLFKSMIAINPNNTQLSVNAADSLFIQIDSLLDRSNNETPIIVKGNAGYGKTAFLSVLYLHLYSNFKSKKSTKLPIYISLHHYNKYIYANSSRFSRQAIDKLHRDIDPLFSYLQGHQEQEVVIIIDGTDEFAYAKVELDDHISRMIADMPINGQIIGLRGYVDKYKVVCRKKQLPYSGIVPEVEFNKVKVGTGGCDNLINSFSLIESQLIDRSAEQIKRYIYLKINKFKLKEIDYFHLYIFSKGLQNAKYSGAKSIGVFYQTYIEECQINLEVIAGLAFKMFNTPGSITNQDKNSREWWKIQKHDSLRDYLTAYNIVEKLIAYTPRDADVFNFVYPYELNSFCKEIINESSDNQRDVFHSIQNIFSRVCITAKTHFCYLLGRFQDDNVKQESLQFLRNLEQQECMNLDKMIPSDSTKELNSEQEQVLLYYRTICISLVCLGDNGASSKYIKRLVNSKYFDNLNRGFHLQYYEDIPFSPASPQSLKSKDNLGSFSKTYERLTSKLDEALKTGNKYPLFEIELYTICSLAQHRQAAGKLEEEKRVAIEQIINMSLQNKDGLSKILHTYLTFINDGLSLPGKFKVSSFINNFYSLKQLPRKGWIKRGVENPETVASHIYGAMLLAYIHLPSSIDNEEGYCKKKIMQMLLIHDLGEESVGDLTPEDKTPFSIIRERDRLEYLNLMGTYEGLSSKMDLLELYTNFTDNKTDINCIIAREIDKLDNLLQLYIYNKETHISDFEHFKN
ncbi:MAG: HD domain-containing protein, partial [Prevotellaceae bacterium]|nr:HD domain-containing protein [Prevotellaceae bacterium]